MKTMAKNCPIKATKPHINIVGHITREELRCTLADVDAANGFANRFLWVASQRSKLLPDGGQLPLEQLRPIAARVREAVQFAQEQVAMVRSDEARELWQHVYADLSADRSGFVGLVTNRGEAQTLRLSLLFSILDQSPKIDVQHLQAAMACWRYCEQSAVYAFGKGIGDPTQDDILAALRHYSPDGLMTTQIHDLFKRNKSAAEIRRALGSLLRIRLIRREKLNRGEKWFST